MVHWAHAFCVAARPSLDLSLLDAAANTRNSFYTATVKTQPYSTVRFDRFSRLGLPVDVRLAVR
jgi:hypothetical protein